MRLVTSSPALMVFLECAAPLACLGASSLANHPGDFIRMSADNADSLRARLDYEPVPLAFGTSGRRGLVVHLTQLEIYINARAELQYLLSLPAAEGGLAGGQEFFLGCDLRPSSSRFVAEEQGRGEIAQAP